MKRRLFIVIAGLLGASSYNGYGQSTNVPLNRDYYHLIDRLQIKSGNIDVGVLKPISRQALAKLLDTVEVGGNNSNVNQFNWDFLRLDNWDYIDDQDASADKVFLKHFYKTKPDFYSVKKSDFQLRISPVIHLSVGQVSNDSETPFINTRGVELHGIIDKKVGFYTYLGENQAKFPVYVRDWVSDLSVVPGEGFWKDFKNNGVDFFHPRGYISVDATRHINFQFGHDRLFVGNGYRSLILSDFAPPYLFLKIDTRVWKLQYTNLFTQMRADAFGASGGSISGRRFPDKYITFHHLGVNITDNLNIGLFESVIFGREDSTGNNSYDLNYLNPIIFYRAIEQQNGSVDNAILGMDVLWNIARRYSIYGQVVIDEFVLDEFLAGSGWWGNKYGFQIGAKYLDAFGLANFDLQLEYNTARPYTYSHQNIYTNYAHYRQPLAHPLGANFKELIGIARYQPLPRLGLKAKLILAEYGADTLGANWGANVLLDNRSRERRNSTEQDEGHFIGQGINTDLLYLDLTASYQLKHNLFIDGSVIYRDLASQLAANNRTNTIISLALRLNIPQRLHEF